MKPSTTFTVARNGTEIAPEFFLHEQCSYDYGRISSVRACLTEHLEALRRRTDALVAILATSDPEKAEALLFDQVSITVTEVSLRARSEFAALESLMKVADVQKDSAS